MPPRRWFSPPRLALYAVVAVAVATAWYTWSQSTRKRNLQQLQVALDEGRAALARNDFVFAQDRLGVAAAAARGLGGATSAEIEATQLHRESVIWSQLASDPLEDFFAPIAAEPRSNQAGWPQRFRDAYAGSSVVIDAFLLWPEAPENDGVGASGGGSPPAPTLEWTFRGEEFRAQFDLRGVSAFDRFPRGPSARVLVGLTLKGLRRSENEPGLWWIEVEPERCALLTQVGPLEYFGWPMDDATRDLLSEQAKRLGVES